MTIIEKMLVHSYATIILSKTLTTSHVFEHLKNLWHIDLGTTNHICLI